MNATTRKKLYSLHRWTGWHLGYLLYVICLTGSLAVFTPEWDRWWDSVRRVDSPPEEAGAFEKAVWSASVLPWGGLLEAVEKAYPGGQVRGLMAPADARSAATALVLLPPQDVRVVFIDPYRFEVTGQRTFLDVKSFVRILHKQLYLVPNVVGFHGTWLVGLFGLVLVLAAVSGLFVFREPWLALVTLRWRKSGRLFRSDLHRFCGIWSLLIGLLLAATGFYYWIEKGLEASGALEHEDPVPSIAEDAHSQTVEGLRELPLDELIASALAAFPDFKPSTLRLPGRPGEALVAEGQTDAMAVRDRANQIALDPFTGEVLYRQRAVDLPLGERLMHTMDPLHFGTFGGLATRLLWFAAGLVLTIGILLGLVMRVSVPMEGRKPALRPRSLQMAHGFSGLTMLGALVSGTLYILHAQIMAGAGSSGTILKVAESGVRREQAISLIGVRPEVPLYVWASLTVVIALLTLPMIVRYYQSRKVTAS